jgi:hypothetical protein
MPSPSGSSSNLREQTIAGSDEETEPPPSITKFEPKVRPRKKRAKSLPPTEIVAGSILKLSSLQKDRVIDQWNALIDSEKDAVAKGVPETPMQKFTSFGFHSIIRNHRR